MQAGRNEKIST